MMKTRYTKILILISIMTLAAGLVACGKEGEEKNKTDDNPQIAQQQPKQEDTLTAMNALLVQDYLKKNISDLSPEKEVLGGKFFLTNLKFLDNKNAEVDYEDGHIALRAKVGFVIEVDSSGEKTVRVNSFEIIK